MAFEVPDTLSGRRRVVRPAPRRPLRLYVCGPTVYDAAHVGHARTYLYFDLVRRWFEDQGIAVRHVMNITDFEDKITDRAQGLGLPWCSLARREEARFLSDMRALGLRPPHEVPRASDFVPQMISAVRRLERRHALERRPDGLYYRGTGRPGPNFEVGEELARHAVLEAGGVRPLDPALAREFLVWKPQEAPSPSWPSPWGPGAPGWHLECYAMASEYLSLPVDLHGGGTDLIFPHHFAENEVAYALGRQPFSRAFLHTAFVTSAGRKISKSAGNLVPLREALDEFGAPALRWYLLGRPFTEPIEWRNSDAARAARAHASLRREVRDLLSGGASGTVPSRDLGDAVDSAARSIADGFRVEAAFRAVAEFVSGASRRDAPRFRRGERREARSHFRRAERLLGIPLL